MSKKNSRPEWHEPVEMIGDELNDPIKNTVEVGSVALVDGPIDPVPLTTGTHDRKDYAPPRSSVGPMPDFDTAIKDTVQTAAATAQAITPKITDKVAAAASVVSDAGSATKSVISTAAGKVGSASAAGAQSAGAALWTLVQRSPLQALLFFASLIWLIRHHKAASSLPPVSLSDVTNEAAVKAGSVVGQVQATAETLGSQVQEQAQRGKGWFSQTLQDNPLAVGAMAIVFGACLGFAVPETAYEHRLLGKTRDSLADKAQEAAQDLSQKVQTVAQTAVHEVIETVKEEAKNQGLVV